MAYASINARKRTTNSLIMEVSETTPDFDHTIVDHDYLADQIGKAIVRAINHCRTIGQRLNTITFTVDIHH